jgi:hypothetical protein
MYATIALGAIASSSLPYEDPEGFIKYWRWFFGANVLTNVLLFVNLSYIIECDSPKFYH